MNYKVPLFKLNFDGREEIAIQDTLRSKWISMGPKCAEFESRFSEMLDIRYSVAISNCTGALHLALAALDVGAGDEVLCPSLSFVATVNCIRYVNASPVFCDVVSNENPTIDPEEIKSKFTSKTKAIIVMHFGGYSCEMNQIMDFAREKGIAIIEDACHAPLSEYNGKKLGTLGDVGCFSFFSNKNISTGEGGMLVTNRSEIADRVKRMRSHGMTSMSYERSKGHATKYDVLELGNNYRMDDIRCALGLVQLDKLPDDLYNRSEVRNQYLSKLHDVSRITIPFMERTDFSSNYIFPMTLKKSSVDKRDDLRNFMHNHGVQTSVHYPAIHRFSIYSGHRAILPNTEYISDNSFTLPMYGGLSESEIDLVCGTLREGINEVFG